MKRKAISFLLILCMVLSFVPTAVFGAGRYAVNNTKNATGATILQEARKWANRGAKYWSGTEPWEKSVAWRTGYTVDGQTSFDCSGFVGRILNDAGFRGASYAPSYGNTVLSQNYGRYSIGISIEELVSYGRDLSSAVSKARNGDYSGLQAGDIIGWTSGSLGRHIIIYAGLNSSGRPTMIEFTGSGYLERVVSSSYQNAFQFGARLTEDAGSTGNGTALSLSNGNYPTSIDEGNVFSVTGEITSGSQLTSVTVAVYDMSGKFQTGVQNVNPNSSYYNIKSSADAKVYFNHLSAGTYRYIVSAKNSAGTSKEFVNRTFQVIGKPVYYTVVFDANGGTVSPSMRTIERGNAVGTLPTPSRTGYNFDRWADSMSGGTTVTSQTPITKNTTIYAQWTPKSYTITFDANEGYCSTSSITRTYNSELGELPKATRPGYFFMGWYRGSDRVSSSTKVTDGMSLTAKWENAVVAYPVEGGNLYFDKTSGTITNCDQSVTAVNIPTSIEGYTVERIGLCAFRGCCAIEELVIPFTIRTIGESAFAECKELKRITLPNSISSISARMLADCTSLTTVIVPNSVKKIDWAAFKNCSSLESVFLPQSLESINSHAFDSCSSLKEANIPNGIKEISFAVFQGCTGLKAVTIPESVELIDTAAFNQCQSLTRISLPEGLLKINPDAFADCDNLTSVTLPSSVTDIKNPFHSCDNLQNIYVSGGSRSLISSDGVLMSKDLKTLLAFPSGREGEYVIPDTVETVEQSAFQGSHLSSITFGNSVKTLGYSSFADCNDIEAIELPSSVEFVGNFAFKSCCVLKNVIIHEGTSRIYAWAFYECPALESVALPKSLKTVDVSVFKYSENIKYVFYTGSETDWNNISFDFQGGNETIQNAAIHYNSTGHDWKTSKKDATCTEAGSINTYCSVCGEAESEIIHATGHQWNSGKVTKAATCIEEGTKQFTCTACGETRTEPIPVTEHNYSKTQVIAPSCTQDGYTKHTCTCGEFYFDNYISALGHTWSIGVVTKQPTGTTEGVKTFTCTVCGETRTESIPALSHSHSYTAVVTPPTCTEKGFTTHTCSCGDSYVDSYTAPTGHSWGEWSVLKQPTDKAEGERVRVCSKCGAEERESIDKLTPSAPTNPFVDVKQGAYYYDPVLWAINHQPQITNGTSATTFSPNANCTRGQIVTFLWRAKGQPEPKRTDNPFVDVKPSDYYYKAVLWAVEQEITNGTDATHFSPNASCTRGQAVTFLWRAEGKPAQSGGANAFTDVKPGQYYYDAVLWAVKNGITNGTSATTFSPDATCTRGQIVTFLYRDMA